MGKVFGEKPSGSRHRTCRRMPRSIAPRRARVQLRGRPISEKALVILDCNEAFETLKLAKPGWRPRSASAAWFGGLPPDEEKAGRYFVAGGAGAGSGGRVSRNGGESHTFAVLSPLPVTIREPSAPNDA